MRDRGRTHLHFHFVVFLYIPRFTPRARGGMARGRTFFEAGCVMGFELPTDDSWDAEVFLGQWWERRKRNLFVVTHSKRLCEATRTNRSKTRGRDGSPYTILFNTHTPTDALRIFFVYW